MDMNACLPSKKMEIVRQLVVVLPSADQSAHFGIEGLYADLELQRARRKPGNHVAQRVGEPVGNHLEMHKLARAVPFVEKLQNRFADADVQVEGAVHKFELFHAAVEQSLESVEQRGQGKLPHGNVQGRQAEFAGKRTAARGFHVNHPMRHVVLGVQVVRQSQPVQIRRFGGDDFLRRGVAGQQLGANPGEFQIRLARDHVVGQPHDFLCLDLETDFRSAQDDGEVGPHPFQRGDDLRRLRNVPDVNSEADDFGASRQQHFHDIERSLLDVELDQAGARFQIAQVSQQITQAKGGVNVFCVQCGQDDVGHKVGGVYHAPLPSSKRNKARITGETNNFFVLITWE